MRVELATTLEMEHEPVYTIGHAAQKLQISVPTVRMYEQAGLFLTFRTETGRRLYSRHDLYFLNTLLDQIRNHGLNLQALRRIAATMPCWLLANMPEEQCKTCIAYQNCQAPCWIIPNTECKRLLQECRSCSVYRHFPNFLQNPKIIYHSDHLP